VVAESLDDSKFLFVILLFSDPRYPTDLHEVLPLLVTGLVHAPSRLSSHLEEDKLPNAGKLSLFILFLFTWRLKLMLHLFTDAPDGKCPRRIVVVGLRQQDDPAP
jgi:hypothetical protein